MPPLGQSFDVTHSERILSINISHSNDYADKGPSTNYLGTPAKQVFPTYSKFSH